MCFHFNRHILIRSKLKNEENLEFIYERMNTFQLKPA